MSSPPPVAPPPSSKPWFGLSRRTLLLVAIAFVVGLALFLLLLAGQRDEDGFFRAGDAPAPGRDGQVFEPLPTPDAAGARDAGPDQDEGDAVVADPRDEQDVDERGFPIPEEAPDFEPVAPAPPPPPAATARSVSAKPIRSPRPDYPASALRRGESGTVLLQVHVDAQGRPAQVDVVQSSRSRALDREAERTVRRWEFSPALRNGQPVPATVLIPVEFNP